MNKQERISKLLKGEQIDRTPAAFWLHFPDEIMYGEAAVDAHIQFMKDTDTDFYKIMNENMLWDGEAKIDRLSGIKLFRGFSRKDKIYQDQMELIKRITDHDNGETPSIATIHGIIASASHETGFIKQYSNIGYMFPLFCRERPEEMKQAFKTISESLMEYVDCSIEAGATGIFYAGLGAEKHYFTNEEYAEFVAPYEKALYDHIKKATPLNVLHICKSNIDLERYSHLDPAIVNWAALDNNIPLTQGRKEFFKDSVVLGGFSNHSGVLINGTPAEIGQATKDLCAQMKDERYIVGADCSLPTDIDRKNIVAVVDAVKGNS